MIDFINSWVQGIIIAVIISTVIEMILPNGNIKKYVRTVIGAYIVFVIISPFITKITGEQISLSSYKLPKYDKISSIDTNAYIESTYINYLKQDIIENIEKKGYKVESLSVDIDKTEDNYGELNQMILKISKQDTSVSSVEPVEININSETQKLEAVPLEEMQELKDFLKETYGTQNISINE